MSRKLPITFGFGDVLSEAVTNRHVCCAGQGLVTPVPSPLSVFSQVETGWRIQCVLSACWECPREGREAHSSPLSSLSLTQGTLAPGLVSVALAASPCDHKGISVDANGLFVGRSRAL